MKMPQQHLQNVTRLGDALHSYCRDHGLPLVVMVGCSKEDYYHASWMGDLVNCPGIVQYVMEEFARARAIDLHFQQWQRTRSLKDDDIPDQGKDQ